MPYREHELEREIVGRAEAAGWLVRKLQWVGRTGAPDRLFVRDGRVVFIEFKRPGGRLSPRQRKELLALSMAGAEVHVVDNLMDVLEILEGKDASG